jgi:hypothetical protein
MAQPQCIRQAPDLPAARFDLLYAALRVVERAENHQPDDDAMAELLRAGRRYRDVVDVLKTDPLPRSGARERHVG